MFRRSVDNGKAPASPGNLAGVGAPVARHRPAQALLTFLCAPGSISAVLSLSLRASRQQGRHTIILSRTTPSSSLVTRYTLPVVAPPQCWQTVSLAVMAKCMARKMPAKSFVASGSGLMPAVVSIWPWPCAADEKQLRSAYLGFRNRHSPTVSSQGLGSLGCRQPVLEGCSDQFLVKLAQVLSFRADAWVFIRSKSLTPVRTAPIRGSYLLSGLAVSSSLGERVAPVPRRWDIVMVLLVTGENQPQPHKFILERLDAGWSLEVNRRFSV